jgi:hypothetical protein
MKYFNRYSVVRLCILNTSIYWAAETHAQNPPVDVIEPIKRGQTAPFDGQLFDTPTAIRWGLRLRDYQTLAQAQLTKEQGVCKANLDYKDSVMRAAAEKDDILINDLKQRVLRADGARVKAEYSLDHPAWYSTMWFGFGVGALSTVAVVLVAHQAF